MYQAGRKAELERILRPPSEDAGPEKAVASNVIFLGLTSLVTDISSEMVASVLPLYLIFHLQQSPLGFGALDGLRQGAGGLLALVSGFATDRSRRHKQIAALGYGISALYGLGLFVVGSTWPGLVATTILDRLGKGIRVVPRDALISLSARRENLGRAFGVHRALDTTGSMLGPIAAFALMRVVPGAYDVVFVSSFFIALMGLGILVTFVKNPPTVVEITPRARVSLRDALGLLRGRSFRVLVLCGAVLGTLTMSDGFVYLLLQRRVRFDESYVPLLYVATPAVYMLLAIPMGRLADRVGRGRVFAGGHALLLLLYGCALLPAFGLPELAAIIVLLGGYYACTDGVLMALVSGVLPIDLRASGLSIVTTASGMSRFVASLFFGFLWTKLDLQTAVSVFGVGLSIALGGVIVALCRIRNEAPS